MISPYSQYLVIPKDQPTTVPPVLQPIMDLVDRIRETAFVKWFETYKPATMLNKVYSVITNVQKGFNGVFAANGDVKPNKVVESVKVALQSIISKSKILTDIIEYAALSAIAVAPYSIYQIATETIAFAKGTTDQKIDAALRVVEETSYLIDSVLTFCKGLSDIIPFSEGAISWVPVINIVSWAFLASKVVIHVRGCWQTENFMNNLQETISKQELANDVSKAEKYAKKLLETEDSQISKYFNTDALKLKRKIAVVLISATDGNKTVETEKKLQAIVSNLNSNGRVKVISHVLDALSALVNIVGLAVLFTGVCAPVGFGLIALGAVLQITSYGCKSPVME